MRPAVRGAASAAIVMCLVLGMPALTQEGPGRSAEIGAPAVALLSNRLTAVRPPQVLGQLVDGAAEALLLAGWSKGCAIVAPDCASSSVRAMGD